MALSNGTTGARLVINEQLGQIIALRFVGMTDRPVKTVPDKKTKTVVERVVPEADMLVFDSQGESIRLQGPTLVFQDGLGRAVVDRAGDWIVGVLVQEAQKADATKSFYSLDSVAQSTLEAMERAMLDKGIRL